MIDVQKQRELGGGNLSGTFGNLVFKDRRGNTQDCTHLSKRELMSLISGVPLTSKDARCLYFYGIKHNIAQIAVAKKISTGEVTLREIKEFCIKSKQELKT